MHVRDTSINVYHRIEDEGLLSKKRFETYSILFHNGPLTASEVHVHARRLYEDRSLRDSYQPRLTELREFGVVREIGETDCPVTGNRVILWDVTSQMPRRPDKVKGLTTKQKLELAEERLRRCAELLRWPLKKAEDQIAAGKPFSPEGQVWVLNCKDMLRVIEEDARHHLHS